MSETPSGWAVGWAYFAAFMLIIGGVFQGIVGLAAIINDDFLVATKDYVFSFDATAWGWAHLLLGVLLVLSGLGIMVGNVLARTVGVIVAGISAVAAFAFLPWYPAWSIAILAVDLAVIWALTAHGRDVEAVA